MSENRVIQWNPEAKRRGGRPLAIALTLGLLLLISMHHLIADAAPARTDGAEPPLQPRWGGHLHEDTIFDPQDNPHIIDRNLTVEDGVTLTIRPGAEVQLAEDTSIFVHGRLVAEGTPTQTIRFTWRDEGHYWDRIFIDSHADDQGRYADNRIAYAEIAHLQGVHAQFSMLHLLHNEIYDVYGDAVVSTSGIAVIQDNHIHHVIYNVNIRSCEGIQLRETPPEIPAQLLDNHIHHVDDDCIDINDSSAIVRRNHLHHCYDKGISLGTRNKTPSPDYYPAVATIVNNLIYTNDYGIAVKDYASATLLHNTLVGNETGLALYEASDHYGWGGGRARAINNIIWHNEDEAIELDLETNPPAELDITYSDIEGGWEGAANLDIDPGFRGESDYHLSEDSPLIDIGADRGVAQDLDGRPRPTGLAPDLGAYEAQPRLSLTAQPGDHKLNLRWRAMGMPATLASFAISTTYRMEKSLTLIIAPPPITGLLTTTRAYTLTGLVNYTPHTVTVEARDAAGQILHRSPPVTATPTDIFIYLPTILRY
ncbi:MAG: DUF1565 domain-containing protein [Chloroflexi bacterium]|nr:DUF1565 domain-containing protein [Chloroflexota bacterium]